MQKENLDIKAMFVGFIFCHTDLNNLQVYMYICTTIQSTLQTITK